MGSSDLARMSSAPQLPSNRWQQVDSPAESHPTPNHREEPNHDGSYRHSDSSLDHVSSAWRLFQKSFVEIDTMDRIDFISNKGIKCQVLLKCFYGFFFPFSFCLFQQIHFGLDSFLEVFEHRVKTGHFGHFSKYCFQAFDQSRHFVD